MKTEDARCPLCSIAPVRLVQDTRPFGLWECSGCGLLYSSPRPAAEELRAFHDETYFRRYYGESIADFHRHRGDLYQRIRVFNLARLALLAPHAPARGRLLDVGAGQGLFLDVAREAGFAVAGCDVSESVARFHAGRGIEFRAGTVEEAFREPASFDAITLWQTLEHTLDPVRTLTHVRGLLRPGGIALVSVPNTAGMVARVKLAIGKPFLGAESTELHFFHFTPASLTRVLAATGFRIVRRDAESSQERRPLVGALERFGDVLYRWTGLPFQGSLTTIVKAA